MPYSVGDVADGIVSGVTAYGAFVEMPDGSTGMIHISKLSNEFVKDINSFIKKGDKVTATVISQNGGKLALSLVGADDFSCPRVKKPKADFESMLSAFKSTSEEKFAGMNSRNKRKRR